MKELIKPYVTIILLIITILVIVVICAALGYIYISKPTQFNREANPQFGTMVAQVTFTPGPSSNQLETALPPLEDIESLGDVELLRELLSTKIVTDTLHVDVAGYVGNAGVGWYCSQIYIANPFNLEEDLVAVPGTTYGSAFVDFVDIYGGVVGSDLRNNFQIQNLEAPPIQHTDEYGRIYQEKIDGVLVTLSARFGILSASSRTENVKQLLPFSEPDPFFQGIVESLKQLYGKVDAYPEDLQNVYSKKQLATDESARQMAHYQAIAPLSGDGSRSTKILDLLKIVTRNAYNTPGQKAYENILQDVTVKARAAGFKGPVVMRIILLEAEPAKGESKYYYLHGMEEGVLTPVIPNDLPTRFSGSTCPEYQMPQQMINDLVEKVLPPGVSTLPSLVIPEKP